MDAVSQAAAGALMRGHRRFSPLSVVLLVAALANTGCIGIDDSGERDAAVAADATEGPPPTPEPSLLTWQGYLRAGAAYEVPGHVEETSGAFRPLWSMSFQLHIEDAPQKMEVALSWTAPAARLVLMVTEPFDGDAPTWYESSATDRSPVCLGVPTDALRPGVWRIMAHSQVAVNAALSFDVALTGGNATVVDQPSHAPASEFPLILAEANTPDPLACETA